MSEGSFESDAPTEAANSRYRYGAFTLLALIILSVFMIKISPPFSGIFTHTPEALPIQDTEKTSIAGLSSVEVFVRTGRIDINTADIEGLALLPGIGRGLALRIIRHRQELGGFASLDDLLAVDGIGPRKLASIKGFLKRARQ